MNERYRLNSQEIRAWLDKEDRKTVYLVKRLNVSRRLVDRMLSEEGHIPKDPEITRKLAQLMGIEERQLLIQKAKTA